jgi:putative phosphonate metabolism protein
MTDTPRYAIYFVPAPDSDLYRFGAHTLGYDAFSGDPLPFPGTITQLVPDWHELTQDPRKYGFHATLKAPLTLAPGRSEAELIAACEDFAGSTRPIPVIKPVVRTIGDFIAIVPDEPSLALSQLAQDCVETFDSFRAPLTANDRARRNPAALTPQQVSYLDRWGYPYVREEFRFHMTLTGRVPAERRTDILAMLRDRFGAQEFPALAIDRIALFRQDNAQSRFRAVLHRALPPMTEVAS